MARATTERTAPLGSLFGRLIDRPAALTESPRAPQDVLGGGGFVASHVATAVTAHEIGREERHDMAHEIDGHEAYRDDPDYTSPEMQPGNGEDIHPEGHPELGVLAGAGMTGGSGGGALAGELLVEDVEDEVAETRLHRS
jgi:hypothetical protein